MDFTEKLLRPKRMTEVGVVTPNDHIDYGTASEHQANALHALEHFDNGNLGMMLLLLLGLEELGLTRV